MNFKDVPTKKYDDGSEGSYCCTCTLCGLTFIGHKRDFTCPRDHKKEKDNE